MLDFVYDRVPFDEIWYHYLTGEWRVEPPAAFKALTNVEYLLYKILPGKPHCVECGKPMAGLQAEGLERRKLDLKGIGEKVPVRVITV